MKDSTFTTSRRVSRTGFIAQMICAGLLLCSTTALGQNKKVEPKIEPSDKYGEGGKEITTETQPESGTIVLETEYRDAEKVLKEKMTETTTESGKTIIVEEYDDKGKAKTRITIKKDPCGKEVSSQTEEFQDGVLSAGEIVEWGESVWVPKSVKRWNPAASAYEDFPIGEWVKEKWKKFEKFLNRISHIEPLSLPFPNGCAISLETGDSGLSSVALTIPNGKITVNLPDDLTAGDTFSSTVITSPAGASDSERASNQGELNGYVVELGNQKIPASQRSFSTVLSAGREALSLIVKDKKGHEDGRVSVPVKSSRSENDRPGRPSVNDFHLPTMGQAGKPVQLGCSCDGSFGNTLVKVGGRDTTLLAESPRKVVAQSPRDVLGPTEIEINERGLSARGSFRNLAVNLYAPKTALLKGEQTTLTLKVLGLQGIHRDVALHLENKSPEVISVAGGSMQTVTIHPNDVGAEGTYTTQRTLTGILKGSFTIAANLLNGDPASP